MCASRAARSESKSLSCTSDDIVEFNIFVLDPYQITDARRNNDALFSKPRVSSQRPRTAVLEILNTF